LNKGKQKENESIHSHVNRSKKKERLNPAIVMMILMKCLFDKEGGTGLTGQV
jgi:hypothetical protein